MRSETPRSHETTQLEVVPHAPTAVRQGALHLSLHPVKRRARTLEAERPVVDPNGKAGGVGRAPYEGGHGGRTVPRDAPALERIRRVFQPVQQREEALRAPIHKHLGCVTAPEDDELVLHVFLSGHEGACPLAGHRAPGAIIMAMIVATVPVIITLNH